MSRVVPYSFLVLDRMLEIQLELSHTKRIGRWGTWDKTMYCIQLPNDAESVGYKQTRPFHYEQVFKSVSANFEGTELEFVKAGHGYAYRDLGDHARVEVRI